MSTFVAFIGAKFVLDTSHVIILTSPTIQLFVVFWEVTWKGPKLASTVTVISSDAVLGPKTALSLTVNTKSIVLLTDGRTSQVGVKSPEIISDNWGI